MHKYIVHLDMDAFFAAVEQRDNPELRGKPVIIGADPKDGTGRGVVSTCSYEAREFGVRSAMPISTAYKKCPQAIFISSGMSNYSEVSQQIFDILRDFTPHFEPLSIDEAFMDISSTCHLFGGPLETCLMMKRRIKDELDLTASVGLAPVKMAAKIASDLNKPDGFTVVEPDKLTEFLRPLDLSRLWGVGKKTLALLKNLGLRTIGDLADYSPELLCDHLGKHGYHLWQLANGIDERIVEASDSVASVSNEHTFEKDCRDLSEIKSVYMYLSQKVSDRLRKKELKGRTVSIKIRFNDFTTYTRSLTLESATNFVDVIYQNAILLIEEFLDMDKAIRLIGVKVSKFDERLEQLDFFNSENNKKNECLHSAVDNIKDRYGRNIISRAREYKQKAIP